MKPLEFKEQNIIFAKDQPEYIPLPELAGEQNTDALREGQSSTKKSDLFQK